MIKITLNRKRWNLENKLMDLYFLKTFFGGLICRGGAGGVGKGDFGGSFYSG